MKGMFWQIHDQVQREDFTEAVLEGLCLEFLYQVKGYEDALGQTVSTIRAVGGLCRSDYMMKLKSRMQGIGVEIPVYQQAACFGAAILGRTDLRRKRLKSVLPR